MHRIMADLMSKNFEVVTRPSEENYIMHVPEGGSSNVGNCGVQGVFDRLYDDQQMTVRINNTGSFIPFYEWKHYFQLSKMFSSSNPTGVKYTIEPSYLVDVAGTSVVDVLNPLGAEEAYSIGRWRAFAFGTTEDAHYRTIGSPKMTRLDLAEDVNADYGYVAMAVWVEKYDHNHIWFSLMSNRRRGQATPGVSWPYVWNEPFESSTFSAGFAGYALSCADIVEFDDGSIFMAITVDQNNSGYQDVLVYRSFDYGQTWVYCGSPCQVWYGVDFQSVAIERINERLIIAYSSTVSEHTKANIYYSDDFGMTWITGDSFIDTNQICKQCIELVKGKDNILYLAYVFANGALVSNDVSIWITKTLDGSNLSAAYDTGLKMDTFGMIQDSAGSWMIIGRFRSGSEPIACTVSAATNIVTAAGHTYHNTDRIVFDTLDDQEQNLTCDDFYYVRDVGAGSFKVAATSGGTAIDVYGNLTGTVHEVSWCEYELALAYNENDPMTSTWSATPGAPSTLDYHLLTKNFSTWRKKFRDVAVLAIDNHQFIDLLACYDDTLAYGDYYTYLSEFKIAMWSGITPDGNTSIWDYTWFATCYPARIDAAPNIHFWTVMGDEGTTTLTKDTTNNRAYLRFSQSAGEYFFYQPAFDPTDKIRETGLEIRFSMRMVAGQGCVSVTANNTGGAGVRFYFLFDYTTGKIYLYQSLPATKVATVTPVNWSIAEWNTYHIVFLDDEVALYRATEQYAEILNFELLVDYNGLAVSNLGSQTIYWGTYYNATYDSTKTVDFEFFLLRHSGLTWSSLPIDQNEDLAGRRAYYYPTGLYAGMSIKFDGTYGLKDDTWLVETGAIHEVENIFNPSPAICWKSSSYATDITDEPNEVFVWKQKDSSSGSMYQTVTGFAVFGRNWPYCKMEGSFDGVNYSTIFDSLATKTLSYIMRFAHTNAGSWYNQAIVTIPSGMPRLHVNRFASTPEISFYLMPTSGSGRFHIYKILENDESRFYLDRNMTHTMANTDAMIVFSDRFYFDLTLRARVARADGDIYGDTTFFPAQYRFFRLTIYGHEGSGAANQIIFPESDGGVKKTGSIHLGRVYELPDEEWGVSISLQPSMAVTESRGARKEYRRLGIARRNISLNYTGLIERGLGVNPIVDLNRSLGWGEYPLVFIDDIDVLQYGDVDSTPDTYGTLTHPNPILARMVDGYSMSRVAYSLESENQGDAAMNLTRSVVDVSGIRLEEVV